MKALGVIPARGGSKRIPGKNLRVLGGKPLIQWTIEAANAATALTTFVVSTDNEKIRDCAIDNGAYVVRRPDELATDKATTGSVLVHALEWMGKKEYDIVVCLHPTSPIRNPAHIDEAITYVALQRGYVASACTLPSKTHPNLLAYSLERGDLRLCRRGYLYNGSIYAMSAFRLLQDKVHAPTREMPHLLMMDRAHSMDIDEEIDLKIAELFINGRHGI